MTEQNPNTWQEKPFSESVARAKRLPNIRSIPVALGYPLKVESKSLLLKTPCTSETGPKDPWATDKDAPSRKLAFIVSEGTMLASREEKQPTVPPSYDT